MEAVDLQAASKEAVLEVANELSGAILYADAGAGELLQVPQLGLLGGTSWHTASPLAL